MKFDKFPAYFTKLYVAWGNDNLTIDLNKNEIIQSNMDKYESLETSQAREYSWSKKTSSVDKLVIPFGNVKLIVNKFKNLDIRNGFSVFGSHNITNRSGALEHTIYTKDMKLRKLTTLTPLKRVSDRLPKRVSKEMFYEDGEKGKLIELPIF